LDGKMKIFIAGNYNWACYAPSFCTALEKLGHEIIKFAINRYLNNSFGRLEQRLGTGLRIARMNNDLKNQVRQQKPDICLIWSGFSIWPSTVSFLRKITWVTSYTNDDPFGSRGKALFWRNFKNAIRFYDSHHVYRDINVEEYKLHGAKNIGILRSYYVPWLHFPEDQDGCNPHNPWVSFIGHGEPFRIELIDYLGKNGIPVRVYGPGKTWQAMPRNKNVTLFPATASVEQYRQVIQQSGLCIGFLSRLNRDDYTRRYFEIPACGGVLLAERTNMGLSLYTEGAEAEFFNTPEELLGKCEKLLADRVYRERIRTGGMKRCFSSGYDVTSRAKNWLLDIDQFFGSSS